MPVEFERASDGDEQHPKVTVIEAPEHDDDDDDQDSGPTRVLSLRGVISAVSVLLVILVSAATLSITSVTSLATLRDIGRSYSSALVDSAVLKTTALFEVPIRNMETFRNLSATQDWPWPSDDNATLAYWDNAMLQAWHVERVSISGLILYLWDNTRLSYSPYNRTHSLRSIIQPSPVSIPGGGLGNQTFNYIRGVIPITRDGGYVEKPAAPGTVLDFNTVGGTTGSTLLTMTAAGRSPSIVGYFVRTSSDDRGILTEKYIVMAMPLFRRNATAFDSSQLYGVMATSLAIDDVSRFLAETRATPNTKAFALDSQGFLLGSSILDKGFYTERVIPHGQAPSRLGCATSDSLGAASTGPNTEVCRESTTTYGEPVLAGLPSSVTEADAPVIELVKSDEGVFYVAAARVPLRLPGVTIHLVLLLPEADVIGDLVSSRNAAIGITAGLVLVAAVLNFAIVFILLAPLEGIAQRMVKAANLEDDGAEETPSAMAEVARLQEAYNEMNGELNRIRAFVPQSVLLAKKNMQQASSTDEDDDPDLRCNISANDSERRYRSGSLGGSSFRAEGSVRSQRNSISGRSVQSRNDGSVRFGARGAAAVTGAMALRLTAKTVTVLVANSCDFSATLNGAPKDLAVERITDLVNFVNQTVVSLGGVLQIFHGDHFVATFNAVRPCGAHAVAACRAAVVLRDGASEVAFGSQLRIGVATGRCQVGNLGCSDIKAFATIGTAFQHASILERMNRLYNNGERSVLIPKRTCVDVATQFRFRYVDIVPLPGKERGSGATVGPIALLLNEINAQRKQSTANISGSGVERLKAQSSAAGGDNDDEWLYVVGNAADSDPNMMWNEAFIRLSSSQVAEAKELLDKHEAVAAAAAEKEKDAGQGGGSGTSPSLMRPDGDVASENEASPESSANLPQNPTRGGPASPLKWSERSGSRPANAGSAASLIRVIEQPSISVVPAPADHARALKLCDAPEGECFTDLGLFFRTAYMAE